MTITNEKEYLRELGIRVIQANLRTKDKPKPDIRELKNIQLEASESGVEGAEQMVIKLIQLQNTYATQDALKMGGAV